jgi:hypothetical protein
MKAMSFGAALLAMSGASAAHAACSYDGVYYEHGSQICAGGWLQECTVADYWSAIGMCHRHDRPQPGVAEAAPLLSRLSVLADAHPPHPLHRASVDNPGKPPL